MDTLDIDHLRILMDDMLLVSKYEHTSTNGYKFTLSTAYPHAIILYMWGVQYYIQFTLNKFGIYRHDRTSPNNPDTIYTHTLHDNCISTTSRILSTNIIRELIIIRNEIQRVIHLTNTN